MPDYRLEKETQEALQRSSGAEGQDTVLGAQRGVVLQQERHLLRHGCPRRKSDPHRPEHGYQYVQSGHV